MTKHDKKSLAAVIGATFVTSFSATAVGGGENPFALKELGSGYSQLAEAQASKEKKEMTCGEGRCGAEMMKKPEMKCGAGMKVMQQEQEKKAMEGKCAGMKKGAEPATPPAEGTPKAD